MPLDLLAPAYGGLAALAFATRRHALPQPWAHPAWRLRLRLAGVLLLALTWARAAFLYGIAIGTTATLGIAGIAGIVLVLALADRRRSAILCGVTLALASAAALLTRG